MNYSKDIIIKGYDSQYYFRFLEWDTEFFGVNSYILDPERSLLRPSNSDKRLFTAKMQNTFITAKLDTALSKECFNFFQEIGFRYIDTEITLLYQGTLAPSVQLTLSATPPVQVDYPWSVHLTDDLEIMSLEKNEGLPYEELGGAFSLTRFHYDVRIAKEKADMLWVSYIRNFSVSPQHHIIIAKYKGEIAGAVLINEHEDNKAFLYFVAVIEKFRNRGIGSRLLQHIISQYDNFELSIGTQIRNIGSLNFYIRNGFSVVHSTKTVLHRWDYLLQGGLCEFSVY